MICTNEGKQLVKNNNLMYSRVSLGYYGKSLTSLKKGFAIFPNGLHFLVATVQVKEVKTLITCSYKELQQNIKKFLKTIKKSLKKES